MTDIRDNSYEFVPSEYNAALERFMTIGIRALMNAQGGPYSLASRESVDQLPDYTDSPNADPSQGRAIEPVFEDAISKDEITSGDFEGIVAIISKIAIEFERQISSAMMVHISESAKHAGNVVSGELSFDTINDMVENTHFSFDENGNPNISFVTSPDMVDKIKALGSPTAEQQRRFDEIIAKRRDEWNARRHNRRLS